MGETFDYQTQFETIKKDVAHALTKTLDIRASKTGMRLQARDVYVDDNADSGDWESQRDAVRKDKTWGVPVYATVDLLGRDGKVVSSAKRVKVAMLPKPTDFGSFIVDGKHYQVQNQLRLKPGVYVTRTKAGQHRAEINIAGRPFEINYTPNGVFTMTLKRGPQQKTTVPLYPVLSHLGVPDSELEKAWGETILARSKVTKGKQAQAAVEKASKFFQFYEGEKTDGTGDPSAPEAARSIADYLENTELRPEVTKLTLGKEITKVTPEAIVLGAKELLSTIRGERQPDDRHALQFKKVLALSDLVRERYLGPKGELSPYMSELRTKIERRLNNQRQPPSSVSQLVSASQFSPAMTAFFKDTSLASTPDQTNPINMLNGMSKITVLGDGGVADPEKAQQEEHLLHPSHLGFVDPVHTPDAQTIGMSLNLPVGAAKRGDELETLVYDLKAKKDRRITPSEAATLAIGFPDQFRNGKGVDPKVRAIVRGEELLVDPSEVDVILKSPRQAFSISTNSIPFQPAIAGVRAQMATKMLEQAIPLLHREAPRVQVQIGNQTLEQAIGSAFSVRALEEGVVKSVGKNRVVVQTKDGEVEHPLYSNLPLNNKSFLNAEATVKPGDRVKKGDVIADSNFTRDGTLALGTNLKAAFIPYKGLNFEDGVVITESAAKKLTSEHVYQHVFTPTTTQKLGRDLFTALKPTALSPDQESLLDDGGVVKKGTVLKKGDPLWVGSREPSMSDPDAPIRARLGGTPMMRPVHETWDEDHPGEVVDVVRIGDKVKVYVKTQEPAMVGDKLTNRHAAKGIITKIIPDGQAPRTADGKPIDVLLNPAGIPGRINPSQMLETAASKLAKVSVDENDVAHIVKPYSVDNSDTSAKFAPSVANQLAKAGVTDKETLFDPQTNQPLGDVLAGPLYMLKLSKQATTQFSARSPIVTAQNKPRYNVHGNPLTGGDEEEGSKALDMLSFYSMLSHGARANLKEMSTMKSTKNDEFWKWLVGGHSVGMVPPAPQPTMAYKKFESYLKGAGVNVKRAGSKLVLQPLTDREVEKLSGGVVEEPVFVRGKDLKEEKGGLMDPFIFGGRQGDRWGHIDLAEPIPNPVFEEPIKVLTGLKKAQFEGFVKGRLWLNPETGEMSPDLEKDPATVTGGEAIKAMLSKIDVDQEIKTWTDAAKKATDPKKLDKANKRLKYLTALKNLSVRPEDVYVRTKIPVLPPVFRPVIEMEDGSLSNAGLNTLYRDIALVNKELDWQNKTPFVPDWASSDARQQLYDGVKALTGLGDPIAYYPGSRKPKGIIEQIKGPPAKKGFFQREVLRRAQEPTGRGTIIPEPKLGTDEVGLPAEMAWTIYQPFVMRRLVNMGLRPLQAEEEWGKKSAMALSALEAEMEERPVLLNRAPSLHKFSLMAFKPQITDGHAIKIPPLVVKGFGADFDGDTMSVHVPVLPDAVRESHRLMPSKNLFNPGTGAIMMTPQNEAALGLYMMSTNPDKKEALLAAIPKDLQDKYKDRPLNEPGLRDLMKDIASTAPNEYGRVVAHLKGLGDEHVYQSGFSVGLKDLLPSAPEKDQIFAALRKEINSMDLRKPGDKAKAIGLIRKADDEVKVILDKRMGEQGNGFHLMAKSGARGKMDQVKQIVSAPLAVDDHRGQPSGIPVLRSFADGLPFSDYWSTLYGARSVAVDKQLQTSKPGAFNKDIMATSITNLISSEDCGDKGGIDLDISNPGNAAEVTERYLARDVRVGNAVLAHAGQPISTTLINTLRDRKVNTLHVRSPLTCKAPKGTCAKCYGLNEHGKLPSIGTNVGAIAGQSLSEPLTQMTLRTIHSGGVSGARDGISGYDRVDRLLKMHSIKTGKAVLARHDGKIARIDQADGGKNVFLDSDASPHFVPNDVWEEGMIRVGGGVGKGDALSGGIIQPQELVDAKGMQAAQRYVADQIHDAYNKEKVPIKRKIVETVVRSVGNTTKILDPGDSPFLPGDVAPFTVVQDYNNKIVGDMPVDESLGHKLLEDIPGAAKGETIDERVRLLLQRMGKSKVTVGPKPIRDKPFLTGIQMIPSLRKDWLSQMGYQRLEEAIVGGVAEGRESDIHDFSPVPAFVYGAEFDEAVGKAKKDGAY